MRLLLLMQLMRLLLLLQLGQQLGSAYNYCSNSSHICNAKGLKHFVCEEQEPYLNRTKYIGTIPDTLKFRKIILSYYNKYRNEVAGGYLTTLYNKTFKPASRMRELIWDLELAYTARLHAKSVSFRHSACRSVLRFPHTGECIGIVRPFKQRRLLADILDHTIRFMFETYMEVEDPDRLISSFRVPEDMSVGQFTMLVNDRVSRVGCGFVAATGCQLDDKPGFCYIMTCHYDFINLANSYTYLTGDPTSACSDWKTFPSRSYRNLCHNTGRLFPQT